MSLILQLKVCGILKPHTLLVEGIVKLINKLKNFMTSQDKALSTQESDVEIRESTSIMKAFDITILNESHTLGFYTRHLLINNLEKKIFLSVI